MKKLLLLSLLFAFFSCTTSLKAPAGYDYAVQRTIETIEVVGAGLDTLRFTGNNPSISPDGTKLLMTVNHENGDRNINVIDLQTLEQTPLTDVISYAGVWSPDGSKVAYNDFFEGDWWISVVDLNTKEQRRIKKGFSPVWQDSITLLFHNMDKMIFQQINDSTQSMDVIPDLVFKDSTIMISSSTKFTLSSKRLLFNADNTFSLDNNGMPHGALYYYDMCNTLRMISDSSIDVIDYTVVKDTIYVSISNDKGEREICKYSINNNDIEPICKGLSISISYNK